jgi:hypothetical protein
MSFEKLVFQFDASVLKKKEEKKNCSLQNKGLAMKRTSRAEADGDLGGVPTSMFILALTSVTTSSSASAALTTPCHT